MKVKLESESPTKQLLMSDLKPGDVAQILEGCGNPQYDGLIICINYTGKVANEVGGEGGTWTGLSGLPVRLLTPGEKIVIQ